MMMKMMTKITMTKVISMMLLMHACGDDDVFATRERGRGEREVSEGDGGGGGESGER